MFLPCAFLLSLCALSPFTALPSAAAAAEDASDIADTRHNAPVFPRHHPCNCYKYPPDTPYRHSSASSTSDINKRKRGRGARIAYLIEAHNARTLDDAVHLFRSIRYPGNIIIIHIDSKFPMEAYHNSTLATEIDACKCGADVLVESKFSPHWGKWDMNDPTHYAMDLLAFDSRFKDKWDVFMNLSGDTMPVLTPDRMAELFDPHLGPLRGINFVTSAACETGLHPTSVWEFPDGWHKKTHYTHVDGEYIGASVLDYVDDDGNERSQRMDTYFGSQWMSLQPDFVAWLARSLKREDSLPSVYRDEFIDSDRLMSDETFVSTLLMHTHPFNETLPRLLSRGNVASFPKIYSTRYERMDEHYPTAFGLFPSDQRYDVPKSSKADKPRVWGPYFLGVYDLANIIHNGALFIRKVSVTVDPNIVRLLPVQDWSELPYIGWPDEVLLTEKPNWEKKKAKLKEAYLEKQRKKKEKAEKEQADMKGEAL
mmetsp:Transcript_24627/g.54449  ORF Transcript_24627/g.54449 Transcript_24627/m.54449 type:complete len:482 (+) Transcript_24627:266-1711(+)